MTELPQDLQDLLDAAGTLPTAEFAELAIEYCTELMPEDAGFFSEDLPGTLTAIRKATDVGNADILYQAALSLDELDTVLNGWPEKEYAFALAQKSFDMGHPDAGLHLAHMIANQDTISINGFAKILRETLNTKPELLEDAKDVFEDFLGRFSDFRLNRARFPETTDTIDQYLDIIAEAKSAIEEASPTRGLKFTWQNVTDPDLAKEAKTALEDLLRLDEGALEAEEVLAFPLSKAVKYYREQQRISHRQTFGVEINETDLISPMDVRRSIENLPVKGELAAKYGNTLGSFLKEVSWPGNPESSEIQTIKTALEAADFIFLQDGTAIPPEPVEP